MEIIIGLQVLTGTMNPEAQDTDHWALDHGYVAITPTQIDVTAYTLMEQLNGSGIGSYEILFNCR